MNLTVAGTVFGVIFVAELPDKTALASLVLGARYRPSQVFAGVAAAFAVHVVLAIAAGGLLGMLPRRALEPAVAVLFALGAVLLLRRREEGTEPGVATQILPTATNIGFWRVATRSFLVLFVAEFGDLTQIATANLAARYHDPLAVGGGAVLGLWAVGALAITGGRRLLRLIPFRWISRTAAAVMGVLAVISLVDIITG
ncbi:MAG: TMEM165/GDT1 family protein [Pseudonocardiaceae bacterium]